MLFEVSPNVSTASSAWPSCGSGASISTQRQRCRASLAEGSPRPLQPSAGSVLALAHEVDRERVADLRGGRSGTADGHGEHPAELVLLLQRRAGRLAELQDDALALVARHREGHPAV